MKEKQEIRAIKIGKKVYIFRNWTKEKEKEVMDTLKVLGLAALYVAYCATKDLI